MPCNLCGRTEEEHKAYLAEARQKAIARGKHWFIPKGKDMVCEFCELTVYKAGFRRGKICDGLELVEADDERD